MTDSRAASVALEALVTSTAYSRTASVALETLVTSTAHTRAAAVALEVLCLTTEPAGTSTFIGWGFPL